MQLIIDQGRGLIPYSGIYKYYEAPKEIFNQKSRHHEKGNQKAW
jgi:hypothetical protein